MGLKLCLFIFIYSSECEEGGQKNTWATIYFEKVLKENIWAGRFLLFYSYMYNIMYICIMYVNVYNF